MENQIVTIKHITGTYKIIVPEDRVTEMRGHILKCLQGDQSAFTSKDDNGKETVYPSDLLRNSIITIGVEENFDVNLSVDHNF